MLQILPLLLLTMLHLAKDQNELHNDLFKPNFDPYCISRDSCILDCDCTASDNCFLIAMAEETREDIVKKLNILRDMHSRRDPTPSGLSVLDYDLHLEQLSRCGASKCQNMYTECYRTPQYNDTSQSVGQLTFEEVVEPVQSHWVEIFDYWFKEIAYINDRYLEIVPEGASGDRAHNIAQILSDKVLSIGCSWSLEGKTITFVCTFGPSGPHENEEIYKVGEACSNCPEGYDCNSEDPFQKLCKKTKRTPMNIILEPLMPRSLNESDLRDEDILKKESTPRTKHCKIWWLLGTAILYLVMISIIVAGIFYGFGLSRVEEYPDYDVRR